MITNKAGRDYDSYHIYGDHGGPGVRLDEASGSFIEGDVRCCAMCWFLLHAVSGYSTVCDVLCCAFVFSLICACIVVCMFYVLCVVEKILRANAA